MNWQKLLTPIRLGQENFHDRARDNRNQFQRDYDRLIFSAPFRRLQNKTQVFPLPGSVFVHNRLTHSLEVASVGRSLGMNVAEAHRNENIKYLDEIGAIVSAACLAHDLGNPPFGHSGEAAIATYFSEGEGIFLKGKLTENQWTDFIRFDGNANAFRLLTHQFNGRRPGGFVLTYSTLASIVKYPYASIDADERKQKFGFFTSEEENYKRIADEMGIPRQKNNPNRYVRHPLVYLVEAADDICYQVMDIEDAHKLKILTTNETKELYFRFFTEERLRKIKEVLATVSDVNEQIAYLRSSVIGQLVSECSQVFLENEATIMSGDFEDSLIKNIPAHSAEAYKLCADLSKKKIYRSQEVLDIELAGYKIIRTLIEHFVEAVLHPEKIYSKQLLNRIPEQYDIYNPTTYGKVQAILDYISGMTDVYALDLYKKITGISVANV
ncbi:MAG TPA: deoxyguanosinetriphosphate triphosphohydrolase [Bacteroidales bacterium]|nr:deoxyguanosinetriphosphate triphosphohydrolase [Bacteroidales bacterium]